MSGPAPAIAIALHVDHWDRPGWADRFATHANTLRQYAAMRANGAAFGYTPQVLLQGRDLPAWREADARAAIAAAASRPSRAAISLEATPAGREVTVRADARGRIHARLVFDRPSEAGSMPTIVAFVQGRSDGDVLQALALPLARCGAS